MIDLVGVLTNSQPHCTKSSGNTRGGNTRGIPEIPGVKYPVGNTPLEDGELGSTRHSALGRKKLALGLWSGHNWQNAPWHPLGEGGWWLRRDNALGAGNQDKAGHSALFISRVSTLAFRKCPLLLPSAWFRASSTARDHWGLPKGRPTTADMPFPLPIPLRIYHGMSLVVHILTQGNSSGWAVVRRKHRPQPSASSLHRLRPLLPSSLFSTKGQTCAIKAVPRPRTDADASSRGCVAPAPSTASRGTAALTRGHCRPLWPPGHPATCPPLYLAVRGIVFVSASFLEHC
jgi:hypothetical protein